MTPVSSQTTNPERELLALEAVRQLSAQFAADPDFPALMRLLLLTLSGQFGVPGLMAAVHRPGTKGKRSFLFAVGPFEHVPAHLDSPVKYRCWSCLQDGQESCCARSAMPLAETSDGYRCLQDDYALSIVVPLIRKHDLFGFIGVGRKHTGKPLSDEECQLLRAMIDTVTPLLLNSFLLSETRANSQWYQSLLDNVRQGVFVFDSCGTLILRNQAAASIMRGPKTQARVASDEVMTVSDILARIDVPVDVRKYLTGETTDIPAACSVADGVTTRIYNLSLSCVGDCRSDNRDIVLVLDDVTEAKEAETDLVELEKFAERGAMVASIAHEIRNVLAILKGALELSQIVLKRGDIGRTENYLARVVDSANHLERFAVELMDTRKPDAEKRPMQLNDLIATVVMFLKVQRRFKGINLVTDLDPALPLLEMDNDQISQILLNFLNNSADAIREAKRDEGIITVRTGHNKNGVVLSVTDNGCGIPPELRDKLFRLRFTTKQEGHGFGLVTCARVIENHRAELKVDSEPGAFTTISVVFNITST